jgi:hypothetical protein
MDFAVATFCYGERYYNQTNRLIKSFENVVDRPTIYVVTDNTDVINKPEYVKVKNVLEYNEKYTSYKDNYYDFDFSVKRFSLLSAFEDGYENVILTDTDVFPTNLYSERSVMNSFVKNAVAGQVTYDFDQEQRGNSSLGNRFQHYEKAFNVELDKSQLREMVEDCIQYISIEGDLKFDFINTWSKCIDIKDTDGLPNIPAGNIDEMCFSALKNNIKMVNNSNVSINILVPNHDKWY